MCRKNLFYLTGLSLVLLLSGCVSRTYSLTKDRVDQNLSAGNHGYISGKSPDEKTAPRKTERTIRVFEFEFGKPYRAKQVNAPLLSQQQGSNNFAGIKESEISEEPAREESSASKSSTGRQYAVEKNDTLQKISQKFYGTTKKWTKIYNANKDVLKGPDKVYPGQTLNIPDAEKVEQAAEKLEEPKENLK
ncbi:MAG: LysM peptidoglycan-binding domain-containing protein [Candidatus Omnitrophota bacterium]